MTYEMTIAALENPPQRAIFAALQAGALPVGTLAQGLNFAPETGPFSY
jgi:hypothetical protein